jgi:hypothetical protein
MGPLAIACPRIQCAKRVQPAVGGEAHAVIVQRRVYSQTRYPDPTGSSWVNAMSTGRAEQEPPGRPGHPPGGLFLLAAFNLLTGAGCGCIWLHSAPSPDDADARLLAAGSCVVAVAMLSAGICLLVRRPLGWRLAAGAQLFSSGTQLVLACIGLSMTNTARQKAGDFAGFAAMPLPCARMSWPSWSRAGPAGAPRRRRRAASC